MTDRVLDFSQSAAALSVRNGLLIIRQSGVEVDAIPCSEIAAVIVSNRDVVFTQAVLGQLAEAGAILIACNAKQRPAAMLLPLEAHHVQAGRFSQQVALTQPRQKRLWQQIVKAKIEAQARILQECAGTDGGLTALLRHVRSGDPDNVEARAARRYWSLLFGEGVFVRRDDGDARNAWLDYGYAVLRAATARAICGSGLHPSFGLAHRNKANAFALSDDLMEPFRPVIDRVVARADPVGPLDTVAKARLIGAVTARYIADGENRALFDILVRLAQSLVQVITGEQTGLWLPEWIPITAEERSRIPVASETREARGEVTAGRA